MVLVKANYVIDTHVQVCKSCLIVPAHERALYFLSLELFKQMITLYWNQTTPIMPESDISKRYWFVWWEWAWACCSFCSIRWASLELERVYIIVMIYIRKSNYSQSYLTKCHSALTRKCICIKKSQGEIPPAFVDPTYLPGVQSRRRPYQQPQIHLHTS